MNPYTHLSEEERYAIYALKKSGLSTAAIARDLSRHRSTISRELERNTGQKGYRPKQAHQKYQVRRHLNPSKIGSFDKAFIEHLIEHKWSPEQIHGALTFQGWCDVPSHEWIYQYIYAEKARGRRIHKHLRGQKSYRKRGQANQERRGQIPNRRSIHERERVIEQNVEIGHFEGDTIVGKNHQGALVTLVDRRSMYLCMTSLNRRDSLSVIGFCNRALKEVGAKTVTFDNGKEFSLHQNITECIDVFFADPYKSIQRARNEYTNRLVRQYFPKKTCLLNIEQARIEECVWQLNHRPRKNLGWLTPAQFMAQNKFSVALRC